MRPTGLLSVTFRALPFERIVELAVQAGLDGIEWGGDLHVPPGDLRRAAAIGEATRNAGLIDFAYGSYWRADREPAEIAETAAALGAQWIRVWAGTLPSAECPPEIRRRTVEYLRDLCRRCREGLQVAAEWHCNTLTDDAASAVRLLDEVGEENFFCYFQQGDDLHAERDDLCALVQLPPERIRAVHVNHCVRRERLPLAAGFEEWSNLFAHIPESVPALLEFVRGDSAEQYLEDAATLKKLAAPAPKHTKPQNTRG